MTRHLVRSCVQNANRVLSPDQFQESIEPCKLLSGPGRILSISRRVQSNRDSFP